MIALEPASADTRCVSSGDDVGDVVEDCDDNDDDEVEEEEEEEEEAEDKTFLKRVVGSRIYPPAPPPNRC